MPVLHRGRGKKTITALAVMTGVALLAVTVAIIYIAQSVIFRPRDAVIDTYVSSHSASNLPGGGDSKLIPRIIWTFWDGEGGAVAEERLPKVVRACVGTWRRLHPESAGWQVHIVSRANVHEYLPGLDLTKIKFADNPTRTSDFVRMHLVAAHGGFWVDASIMLTRSLEWFRQAAAASHANFVGYYIDGMMTRPDSPVVENWFFACTPGCEFMTRWRDEFMTMNDFPDVEAYVRHVQRTTDLQKISPLDYLTNHVAAQKVLQTWPDLTRTMLLQKAEDGPFKYLHDHKWANQPALQSLCSDASARDSPIIKFRGIERGMLEADPPLLRCVMDALGGGGGL